MTAYPTTYTYTVNGEDKTHAHAKAAAKKGKGMGVLPKIYRTEDLSDLGDLKVPRIWHWGWRDAEGDELERRLDWILEPAEEPADEWEARF